MEDREGALAVLRRAIRNEVQGRRFYDDAAYYCLDPWAKEAFSTLAREEEQHIRLLLLEYDALERQGQWIDPAVVLGSDADVEITRLSFSEEDETGPDLFPAGWSVDRTIDRGSDDLAALAFGIQMEKKAIALYRSEETGAADPLAREAYAFLVEEEERHYDLLKGEWQRLAGMPYQDAPSIVE
jgi:rubrerythrin